IVVYGKKMLNAVIPKSAKSFNFQRKFKLTNKKALSISDHYPVEVELKTVQTALRQRNNAASHAGNTSSKGSQRRTSPAESVESKNSAAKSKRGQQALAINDHCPVETKTVRKAPQQRKKATTQTRKTPTKRQTPMKGAQKRSKPAESKERKTAAAKRKREQVAIKSPTERRYLTVFMSSFPKPEYC
ncbi:hypothetical protein AMECASPLE_021665, partial [Ameca splendens]